MNKSQRFYGFTLVELIIVIAIIGILATISIVGFGRYQADTRDARRSSSASVIVEALEKYYDLNGEYPSCAAVTSTATNVITNTLKGVNATTIVTPQATAGSTNSIQCTDLTGTSGQPDIFSYIGDANVSCSTGSACLEFTLKYKQESSGTIITIKSRRYVTVLDTPPAPAVTSTTAGNTTTYTWAVASCQVGATATYQYSYSGGYTTSWSAPTSSLSTSLITSGKGLTYTIAVQTKCATARAVSAWSSSGLASYYRPVWSSIGARCGVGSDQMAYCWGANNFGQLGNGTLSASTVPTAVSTSGALAGKTIISLISVQGDNAHCAIASDNQAYCWGYNPLGGLGNGTTNNSSVPVAVSTSGVLSGKTIKTIAGGGGNVTCAIASDNQAYCWGTGSGGSLGNNSSSDSSVPVAVSTSGVLSGKTLTNISVGNGHVCALDTAGKAYCWGSNSQGQLGNGSTTSSSVPVAVSTSGVLNGKTLVSISLSNDFGCALDTAGKAYCWGGSGSSGELGNGSTTGSTVPVAVSTTGVLNGKALTSISSAGAYEHVCALDTSGKAYCWGNNAYNVFCDGTSTNSSVPVAVSTTGVLSGKTLVSITNGYLTTCGLGSDGQSYCWGYNGANEFGIGNTTSSLVPVTAATLP